MPGRDTAPAGSAAIVLRETLAFLAIGTASFALLGLWTYHASDLSESFYPAGTETLNRAGALGAIIADRLFLWMGATAPSLMGLIILLFGARTFLGRPVTGLWYRVPGAAVLLLAVCSMETMIGLSSIAGERLLEGTLPGGIYGVHIAGLLGPALGGLPSFLLAGAIAAAALTVVAGGVPPWVTRAPSLLGKAASAVIPARLLGPRAPVASKPSPPPPPDPAELLAEIVKEAGGGAAVETPQARTEPIPKPVGPDVSTADTEPIPEVVEPTAPVITVAPPPTEPVTLPAPDPQRAGDFVLPPLSLLEPPEDIENAPDSLLLEQADTLRRALASFRVEVRVSEIQRGPAITLYELELAPGTKVTKIVTLSDDLAMALKTQGIRVVYPIPGKSTVGIEVPNHTQEVVRLRDLIESEAFRKRKLTIPLFVGKDTQGKPLIADLTRMPHVLIAGQTGSGKSVCLNSIILSLLFTRTPNEVRLILIDPKQVELMAYESLPHLLTPVVTDMKKAPAVLSWVVNEMERRYERMARAGVRHISSYNALAPEEVEERLPAEMKERGLEHPMPHIVVVVDELGDLMITASREVEESIIRLAQKSRAVGIHAVLATQRPSADVITGLIKSNLPSRIAFQVASRVDSRTILDRNGAEKLQGCGDLLFLPPAASSPVRCQGTYVTDAEIRRAVSTIRQEGSPEFRADLEDCDTAMITDAGVPEDDDLYEQAVQIIVETGRGSASLLQRRLEIGYTRASRLIDLMEKRGVVGPYKGSKAREILITLEEWEGMKSDRGPGPQGASD